MPLFVGTDIGGTFTDLVGYDSGRGALFFGKTLTTPADLVTGVMTCLTEVGIDPGAVDVLKHGTTQIINTLLERTGAKTALVTTEGFRDVVEIGRASRPLAFDLDYQRTAPLVPAPLRLELRERIAADGTVLEPLHGNPLERAVAKVVEDVRSGYVPAESAARYYGVALDEELQPTELPPRRAP